MWLVHEFSICVVLPWSGDMWAEASASGLVAEAQPPFSPVEGDNNPTKQQVSAG